MRFFNFLAELPNTADDNMKSESQIQNDANKSSFGKLSKKLSFSQSIQQTTLGQSFEQEMQSFFKTIEKRQKVFLFDQQLIEQNKTLSKQEKLKQKEYEQKVRSYTSYLIGQKLSKNFEKYSETQILEGNFQIRNAAQMRIITKWCEELWKYFDDDYIRNKEIPFLMKDGNEKFIPSEWCQVLNMLFSFSKIQILKRIHEIEVNSHETQAYFAKLPIQGDLLKFSEDEAKIGQFSSLLNKNYESYLKKYLNLLIHKLKMIEDTFENLKIIKKFSKRINEVKKELQESQSWQQFDFNCHKIEIEANKFKHQNDVIIEEIQKSVPQLISFKIGDLLRCKCTSKQNQIIRLYRQLVEMSNQKQSNIKIVRVKNRLNDGNKDILINVLFKQTVLTEIQLAIKSEKSKFSECSNQFNHFIYELQRAQFGPLMQMVSIWSNFDKRAKCYSKQVQKYNQRKKNRYEHSDVKKQHECCSNPKIKNLNLPFKCDVCSRHYFNVQETQRHTSCLSCKLNICLLCKLEQSPKKAFIELIPQMAIYSNLNEKEIRFAKVIPQKGGILIDIQSVQRKPKVFKVIRDKKDIYFFEKSKQIKNAKSDGKENIKIRLVHKFSKSKSGKQFEQFLNRNIVLVSPEIDELVPQINQEHFQKLYLLPKFFQEINKKQKLSVTLKNNNLQDHDFPNQSFPYVKKLNLCENKLTDLETICLRFPEITQGFISQNAIQVIPEKCIQKWRNMSQLNLSQNLLKQIPANLFTLKKMQILELWENKIQEIPEIQPDMQNLTALYFDSNNIQKIPQNFLNFPVLKKLDFRKNRISKLPNSIPNMLNLEKLNLSQNKIKQIPQKFFNFPKLKKLNLASNLIETLPIINFQFSQIKDISLQDNKITQIPQNFVLFEKLVSLNLSQNLIKVLPTNWSKMKKLRLLNLQGNQVSSVPESFWILQSLVSMNFSNNLISKLPESIENSNKLVDLNFSHNKISVITQNFFSLKNLSTLNLQHNSISELPEIQNKHSNLKYLSLANNLIKKIPNSFLTFMNLQFLSFSNNEITDLPENCTSMAKLRTFRFEFNKIKNLPPKLLHFDCMTELYFEGNEINYLPTQFYLPLVEVFSINTNLLNDESKTTLNKILKLAV